MTDFDSKNISEFCGMSLMPTYLTNRLLLSTTLLGLSVFFILEATATDIPKMVTTDVTAGMNQVSILLTHRDKCVYKLTWRCLSSQVVQTHMRLDGISGSDTRGNHWTWTSAVWLVAWSWYWGCMDAWRQYRERLMLESLRLTWFQTGCFTVDENVRDVHKSLCWYIISRYTLCARVSCNVFWLQRCKRSYHLQPCDNREV
jgi:hypothetical protein